MQKKVKNIFGTCLLLAVLTFILKYLVFNCKRCPDRCPAGCPAGPAEMSCWDLISAGPAGLSAGQAGRW